MKAILHKVSKSYQGQTVIKDLSMTLQGTTVLMAPSGHGKTTLARLLLGLEQPDSGSVLLDGTLAAVFQEDCLCSHLTAVQNVTLVCGKAAKKAASQGLQALGLTPEDCKKPVAKLSGGQARRVALVRAMLAPADGVVLDEPFKGLDDATRHTAIAWTKQQLAGRWLLLITHSRQEAEQFGGTQIVWCNDEKNRQNA